MQEEWKTIKQYSNYAISNTGKFKNIKTKRILKPFLHKKGYFYITIAPWGRQGKVVSLKLHRLIAEAFIPNPENKSQINHIDGNKLNNSLDNLEWVTAKENINHAINIGLINLESQYHPKGIQCTHAVLNEELIEEIRKQYIPRHRQFGLRALARKYSLKHNTLSEALNGVNWSHLKDKDESRN